MEVAKFMQAELHDIQKEAELQAELPSPKRATSKEHAIRGLTHAELRQHRVQAEEEQQRQRRIDDASILLEAEREKHNLLMELERAQNGKDQKELQHRATIAELGLKLERSEQCCIIAQHRLEHSEETIALLTTQLDQSVNCGKLEADKQADVTLQLVIHICAQSVLHSVLHICAHLLAYICAHSVLHSSASIVRSRFDWYCVVTEIAAACFVSNELREGRECSSNRAVG